MESTPSRRDAWIASRRARDGSATTFWKGPTGRSEKRIAALTNDAVRRVARSRALNAAGRSLLGEVADRLVQRRT